MKFEQDWMFEGDHMISGGRFAAERIFAAANPPTAVICSNDLTAVGMLHMAHKLGRKIPEDLSLIGFDDLFIAEMVQPALTTLHLSRSEIAARAFYAVQSVRDKIPVQQTSVILPQLIVRASTATVRSVKTKP